jgi:hypothetical protein
MSVPPATPVRAIIFELSFAFETHLLQEPYYRYTILALNDMASVPITRHITDDTGTTTAQTHSFPYPHLGFIPSHLHPHYVIFHAARMLLKFLVYREQYPSSKYKSIFFNVLFCYASWTTRIANLKMMGKFRPSRHSYDESDSESDSLETKPPSTPRCRELPLPQSSLSQRKKVSIEEWRNSVIEGGGEIREVQVQDAQGWEAEPSSF